jgi:hypothetical protein
MAEATISVLAGAVDIHLVGTSDETKFVVAGVKITQGAAEAQLNLANRITIPRAILAGVSPKFTFLQIDPKSVDEAACIARDALRKTLQTPLVLTVAAGADFFGAARFLGAALECSVLISPPGLLAGSAVGASSPILSATGVAQISMQVGSQAASAFAMLQVRIDNNGNGAVASFQLDRPSLSGFDLRLPAIKFPNLSWPDFELSVPNVLPAFSGMSLPFGGKLTFAWTTPLAVKLTLDAHGVLSLATTSQGNGILKLDSVGPIGSLTNFTVASNAGVLTIGGKIQIDQQTHLPIIENKEIDDARIPFKIRIAGVTLGSPAINTDQPFAVTLDFQVARLEIRAKTNPDLVLAFSCTFSVAAAAARVKTSLSQLSLIDPYPLALINTALQGAGAFVRLISPLDLNLPNIGTLLERIAQMVSAAAKWLAEKLGQAVGVLTGLAEAIAGVLVDAFKMLRDKNLFSHVVIEVRLDPRDYRVRQVMIMPARAPESPGSSKPLHASALGFDLDVDSSLRPALVFNFDDAGWFGIALQQTNPNAASVTLGTDLWLSKETSPAQPVKDVDPKSGSSAAQGRLISITAKLTTNDIVFIPLAIQNGRVLTFQKIKSLADEIQISSGVALSITDFGKLDNANFIGDVDIQFAAAGVKDRILSLLPKPKSRGSDGDFFSSLDQYIQIVDVTADRPTNRTLTINLKVRIVMVDGFKPEAQLKLELSLVDFSVRLTGGEHISIKGEKSDPISFLGMTLQLTKKKGADAIYEQFYLDLSNGKEAFGLGKDVDATLAFGKLSGEGRGLVFKIGDFKVGRNGLNLSASTTEEPVTLGGLDMPFRFKDGSITIQNSEILGGSISGIGQLPPALMGEANATISLGLGKSPNGNLTVLSAEAKLDKSNDPLVCESTRFKFSISKLELGFVEQDGYHFYFLLTGSARFTPVSGEFTEGLLKNLGNLEIVLNRAPLASDLRVLANAISFHVKVDPPKRSSFFDLFQFELRGVGFHPSTPAFEGSPALSISGQVNFAQFGDIISPNFDFHKMWIAPPEKVRSLPRVRFDGLTVGLKLGAMAQVEGTAIAVDGKLPDLFKPDVLPANVTANGFLASGRLAISGWASLSASMGFLELRERHENGLSEPRLAFFFYGEADLLSEKIPTPIGTLFLREVGFGFGWRYTLAGIAAAETAKTPQDLVKILDEVSKYQGGLNEIKSWAPTYDSATLTLAMRALFTVASASTSSHYDEKKEKELPNPVLFDVIAAIRSDLTFLINARAWLAVNYADWYDKPAFGSAREQPSLRGYLYLSVPKQTFLGRFIGDPTGFIGKHPVLPPDLIRALQAVEYSSTIYIRPGLFHFELGWPFELKAHLGKPSDNFYLECAGGFVFRIEDGAMLYAFAFRASGHAQIGGSTGGRFGASAFARADFSLEGKLLSYLSLQRVEDTMFYASFKLDIHISVSVHVWLEFSIFGHDVRWETGFDFGLTVAISIEVALLLSSGVGARVYAAVGLQAFGRSLTLGIELKFNDALLDTARSRVDRFMALGLGVQVDDTSAFSRPPAVESSRAARAIAADARIVENAANLPAPRPDGPHNGRKRPKGTKIGATDFWAMLLPTKRLVDGEWYILQLIPKDLTGVVAESAEATKSTFYAPPLDGGDHYRVNVDPNITINGNFLALDEEGKSTPVPSPPLGANRSMYLTKTALQFQGGKIKLGTVLMDFFMGEADDQTPFTDPTPIVWKKARTPLHEDPEKAARELESAGRDRNALGNQPRTEAEVEERRSAMIGIVGDSAADLAAAGEQPGARWFATKDVNALDFGLTFVIERRFVDTLFPTDGKDLKPRLAKMKVKKRIAASGTDADKYVEGSVYLFNPPSRMFREALPRLAQFKKEVTKGGITFDWDLEPAWGASESVYDDPEFHLRDYRIQRHITGLPSKIQWKASFEVKPSAPVRNAGGRREMFKPPLQFIDDLSLPADLPKDLRNALLGITTDREEWNKACAGSKASPDPGIKILYTIVAVDVAGTSETGTPVEVKIKAPPFVFSPLRGASFEFRYPVTEKGDLTPSVSLRLRLDRKPVDDNLRFEIWVSAAEMLPVGQYGGDALTAALEHSDDSVLAHIADDHKFVVDTQSGKHDIAMSLEWTDESGKPQSKDRAGAFLAANDWGKFAKVSGLTNESPYKPAAHRFFVRQVDRNAHPKIGASQWMKVPVELKYVVGILSPLIDAVVEEFERPIPLDFDAIDRSDFPKVEAGRLHFLVPTANSTLQDFIRRDAGQLRLIRDVERRTAIHLRWHARPESLRQRDGSPIVLNPDDLWRLIGGFDVFEAVPEPRQLMQVSLLPASAKGQEPSELGDLSRIHATYPSDELRETNSGNLRKAPWFSSAESVPVWPDRVMRRSLMTSPDEGVISALFEKGAPDSLRVELLSPFFKEKTLSGTLTSVPKPYTVERVPETNPLSFVWGMECMLGASSAMGPADVRAILQNTRLIPDGGTVGAAALDKLYAPLPDAMAGSTVRITALKIVDGGKQILVIQEVSFDASPSLHPLLADTLDLLHYASQAQVTGSGQVYHRYEIVFDPGPEISAKEFEEWIDSTPAERDPYGWGILRTLGLAKGFRIYDTEVGEFLTGSALLAATEKAFQAALERYQDLNIGSPFVDLVSQPWATGRIFSFDGGFEVASSDVRNLTDNGLLAIIQLSLRPRVDQLTPPDDAVPSAIQYWAVNAKNGEDVQISLEPHQRLNVYIVERLTGVAAAPRTIISSDDEKLPKNYTLKLDVLKRDDSKPVAFLRSVWRGSDNYPNLDANLHISKIDVTKLDARTFEVLSSFDSLSSDEWSKLFFLNSAKNTSKRSIQTLFIWVKRRFPDATLPTEDGAKKIFAGKLANWAERFLACGGAKPTPSHDAEIKFSLATIITPPEWRMPVASDGTVGIFLADAGVYGSQRRFVVRPFGRYRAFHSALKTPDDAPLQNHEFAPGVFADVTLPRTAPVAKPVILSAKSVVDPIDLHDSAKGTTQVLELVVGRGGDEILSEANQTTASGLSAHGISIGFWREFPWETWAKKLLTGIDPYEPLARFGDLTKLVEPRALTLTKQTLPALRDRVPDAWLGAWVFRMASLPYFFRIHALAHSSAGVVISEQSGATFEEGIYNLTWPQDGPAPKPEKTSYRVEHVPKDGADQVQISFEIPLIAFADCMVERNLWLWDDAKEFQTLAFLPDPGISYRIQIESVAGDAAEDNAEPLARIPELELLPSPSPDDAERGAYIVQSVGTRFMPPEGPAVVRRIPAERIGTTKRWKINPQASYPGGKAVKVDAFEPPPAFLGLLSDLVVRPELFADWRPVAPTGTGKLTVLKPADNSPDSEWQALKDALEEVDALFSEYATDLILLIKVKEMLTIIAKPLAERDQAWKLAFQTTGDAVFSFTDWKLGLPGVPDTRMNFTASAFAWRPNVTGTRIQRQAMEDALTNPKSGGNNSTIKTTVIPTLRTLLRNRFLALQETEYPQTGIAPVVRQLNQQQIADFKDVEFDHLLTTPFDARKEFSLSRPKPVDPDWSKNFNFLFACLEKTPFSSETIRTLSVIEDSLPSTANWPASFVIPIPEQVAACVTALIGELFDGFTSGPLSAVLRYPPNTQDFHVLEQNVKAGDPGERTKAFYNALATEQLFGPGRRPILSAVKGTDRPLVIRIARRN